jgi:hypothetical protein
LSWLVEHGLAAAQTRAVLEQVDAHYDTPEKDDPQRLAQFEQFLYPAFGELLEPICNSVEHLDIPRSAGWQELKRHLAGRLVDPLVVLLEHVRFARIRAGRYYFYLHAPSHFSADLQLAVEQSWTRKLVNSIVGSLRSLLNAPEASATDCIRLNVEPSRSELEALEQMLRLSGMKLSGDSLRSEYAQAIEWYPDFYRLIERSFQRLAES